MWSEAHEQVFTSSFNLCNHSNKLLCLLINKIRVITASAINITFKIDILLKSLRKQPVSISTKSILTSLKQHGLYQYKHPTRRISFYFVLIGCLSTSFNRNWATDHNSTVKLINMGMLIDSLAMKLMTFDSVLVMVSTMWYFLKLFSSIEYICDQLLSLKAAYFVIIH